MEENQIKQKTPKNPKENIIKFLIMLISVFVVELFFRNPIRALSTKFQTAINFQKANLCESFYFLSYIENESFFLLLILLLNFTTTYAALSVVFLRCFVFYLNGILKLIYLDPRPYWIEQDLHPCVCAGNYGNPSTSSFSQFLIYLTTYKAFSTTCKVNKNLLKIICFIPPFLVVSGRILQNIHSFNQIFFGISLGYVIYYFVFDVLRCNFNNEKQFRWIIKRVFTITATSLFMCVFAFLLHWSMNLSINNDWLNTITKYCEYKEYEFFDNESYVKTVRSFLFLGSLFGCYLEYSLYFKNKIDTYVIYNVNSEKKFNNTNLSFTLVRIALMFVTFVIFNKLVRHISIFDQEGYESFAHFLIFKSVVPLFLDGACLFSILKIIVDFFRLTNDRVTNNLNNEKHEISTTKSLNDVIMMSLENNIHENLL